MEEQSIGQIGQFLITMTGLLLDCLMDKFNMVHYIMEEHKYQGLAQSEYLIFRQGTVELVKLESNLQLLILPR